MKINANGTAINVLLSDDNTNDYISLTDIAKRKNPEFPADVIKNWLRLRSTIEYLGVWFYHTPFSAPGKRVCSRKREIQMDLKQIGYYLYMEEQEKEEKEAPEEDEEFYHRAENGV